MLQNTFGHGGTQDINVTKILSVQQKLQQEQQPGQQLAHLAARLGCVADAALFVLAESVPG